MRTLTRAIISLSLGLLGFFAGAYVKYNSMSRLPFFGEYVTIVSGGYIDRGFFSPDLKVAGAEGTTRWAVDSFVKANPDASRQEAFLTLMRRNAIHLGFQRLLWPGVLGCVGFLAVHAAILVLQARRSRHNTAAVAGGSA